MPRNPYPGTKINHYIHNDDYFETKVSFDHIYNDPRLNSLEKPVEQGSLDLDKVGLMIEEYKIHPEFLRFKNRIVVSNLNNTWYIVDGQHRIEMAKQLYGEHCIDDELIFCWYRCYNENEMRLLFNSINQDSTKNRFYIQQTDFDQVKINEFTKSLQKFYKSSFVNKKTTTGKIKTKEELRDDLIEINFFENQLSVQELMNQLKSKNNEFYNIARFKVDMIHNPDNFYKSEIKYIEQGIIFSLKETNFIEWLQHPEKDPIHNHKKGKKRITKKLKDSCWIQEFGNNCDCNVCPISTCSIEIYKNKTDTWHAGHVISENNGGDTIVSNLRPICKKCNLDMGSKNWIDYES
jgi:hypothetical protein